MLTTGPASPAADQLSNLLAALADPARTKQAIADLRAAETAANAAQSKAADDAKRNTDLEDELKKTADKLQSGLDNLVTRASDLDTREGALKGREDAIAHGQSALEADTARLNQRHEQRMAELDAREKAMNDAQAAHETDMTAREQTAAEREAGAKATMDQALALKADFEARAAKLTQAIAS
jgi:chromosome segregation ATPase